MKKSKVRAEKKVYKGKHTTIVQVEKDKYHKFSITTKSGLEVNVFVKKKDQQNW